MVICCIQQWCLTLICSCSPYLYFTYYVSDIFRQLNWHLSGKELFILFAARAFLKLLSFYVFSYFPFGFEGRIWDLIVSVSDHRLSFYLEISYRPHIALSVTHVIYCPHKSPTLLIIPPFVRYSDCITDPASYIFQLQLFPKYQFVLGGQRKPEKPDRYYCN